VDFAELWWSSGKLWTFPLGKCNSPNSQNIVEQVNTFFSPYVFLSLTHRYDILHVCIFLHVTSLFSLSSSAWERQSVQYQSVDKNIFDKQRNSYPGSPKTLTIQAHWS
jgi:hypothetical protein